MAGFFDTLLGLESDPERRDYKRLEEITNPEELEAYRAGQSATGIGIPGLDYARSILRGLKGEVTDASMSPLGERFNQELDRYRRRQEAFKELNRLYPEAVRGGRLRGSEAIPGAEIGLMAQPAMAGAAGAVARGAARSAPEILEREVGATPRGWDFGAQRPALPILEGEFTEVPGTSTAYGSDPFFGLPRTDRATPWRARRSVFEDPSLNPEVDINARRSMSQEMHAGDVAPEMQTPEAAPVKGLDLRPAYDPTPVEPPRGLSFDVYSPKSKSALLELRNKGQAPSPFQRNYLNAQERKGGFDTSDIIFGQGEGMNPKIYDLLLRTKLGGKPLTPFEQNMVNNYMTSFKPNPTLGLHGEGEIPNFSPPKVKDTTIPPTPFEQNWRKSQQAALNRWREENGMRMPGVMPRDPRYQAYLEEELPVVYKPNELVAQTPLIEQQAAKNSSILNDLAKRYNWKTGLVGAGGGILGGVAAADKGGPPVFPIFERPETRRALLPPMDIGGRKMPDAETRPVIAETKKETPTPSPAPRRAAPRPAPRPVSRPAPARRAAPSDQLYYGDYRDVEPFASDPIGNFIDELTGQRKTSRKRGTINSRGSLGDLLPFENGGTVRHHYADGGTDDGLFGDLGDLGDMVGGLFGETEAPSDAAVASDAASPASGGLFSGTMSPLSQFLLSSGLAMMAAPTRNPFTAIGQGGLKGLEYLRAAQSAQASLREKEQARADRLRQLKLIENLDGPVAEDNEEAPSTSAGAAPNLAPIGTPSTATGSTAAPAATETSAAETPSMAPAAVPAEAPSMAPAEEKEVSPIVATDRGEDRGLKAREALHNKISRIMPAVTDPQLRAALANRQRALEFEINKIEQRSKDAAAERRYQQEAEQKAAKAKQEAFAASPTGVMQKARIEAGAKQIVEDEQDIRKTISTLDTLDNLESILDKGMYSGPGSDIGSTLGTTSIMPAGVKEKAERSREFDRIAKDIVYLAADKKLNAGTSNADIQFLKEKGPNLGLTVEGNRQAIEYMRRAAQRKIDITTKEQEYIKRHGYLDDGFYKELEQWSKDNPLFTKEEKAAAPKTGTRLPESLATIQSSGNLQRKGDLFRDKSTGIVYDKTGKRVEQ